MRRGWLRYPLIWIDLFKYSLIRELEFKTNFLGRVFVEAIWMSTQILFYVTALKLVDHIGNLSGDELWFFMGTTFFVDGLFMLFSYDNQKEFSRMVRGGLLDFHLLRPLSSLFLANFRLVNAVSLFNIVIATGVLTWSALRLGLGWENLLLWGFYVGVGFTLICCFVILICSVAFWTTQSTNILWIFFEIYRLSWRPETIYGPWLRRMLMSIFPAALFMSIPVQIALGKRGGVWYVYPILVAGFFMALTLAVWKRGLRRYEGAMS